MQRSCTRFKREVAAGSNGKARYPVTSPNKSDRCLPAAHILGSPSRIFRQPIQREFVTSAQSATSLAESHQEASTEEATGSPLPPVQEAHVGQAVSADLTTEAVDAAPASLAESAPAGVAAEPTTTTTIQAASAGVVDAESAGVVDAESAAVVGAESATPVEVEAVQASEVTELQFQAPNSREGGTDSAGAVEVEIGAQDAMDAGESSEEMEFEESVDGMVWAVTQIMGNEALRSAFLTADESLGVEAQNNIMSALSGVQVDSLDSTVSVTVELQAAGPSGLFRGSFLANRDDVLRNAPALLSPAFSAPMQQLGTYFVHATTSEVLKELLRFIRMKGKQAAQWEPATEDPQVLRELRQVALELELNSLAELIQAGRATGSASTTAAGTAALPTPITNTFVKDLVASGRHLQFQTLLEEVAERKGAAKRWESLSPCWMELPAPPLIGVTRRNRVEVENGSVQIMHRGISSTMYDFMVKHHPNPVPVTIIGPPGFGKSHSLLEAVSRLKAESGNRVVYIPDCQGWACEAGNGPLEYLLEAVVSAFPRDEEVIQHCLECRMEEDCVSKLLKWLPEYCEKNGLKLFAVFDGHSGLTTEQRQSVFPLNIAENLLAVSAEWKSCSVIICGSASYNYKLIGNQDGSWPLFDFCQGLNDEEFEAWIRFKRLPIPNRFKGRVKFETSSIPLELWFLLQTYKQTQPERRSIPDALQAYRVLRAEALTEQQYTFSRECLWKMIDEDGAIAAITAMHLKLGLRGASQALEPNLSLMYKAWIKVEDDGSQVVVRAAHEATYRGLLPITPLAAQVLTTYWGQRATDHQLATIQEVFTSDLYDAREKGMALQRHFESNLRARMHLDLVGYVIQATTSQDSWPEVMFSMDDIRLVTLEYGEVVPMCDVDWQRGTIFRPACRMSAGPDYVLWSPERAELLALRVTTLPLHKKIGKWRDFTDSPVPQSDGEELLPAYKQWETRLAEDLGEGNFKIKPGWLTTNLEVGIEFHSHYVFPHNLLEDRQFPLMDLLPNRAFR